MLKKKFERGLIQGENLKIATMDEASFMVNLTSKKNKYCFAKSVLQLLGSNLSNMTFSSPFDFFSISFDM